MSRTHKELARLNKIIELGGSLSWGEIAFLSDHKSEIKAWFPNSPALWEWAGIDESEWLGKEV